MLSVLWEDDDQYKDYAVSTMKRRGSVKWVCSQYYKKMMISTRSTQSVLWEDNYQYKKYAVSTMRRWGTVQEVHSQ